MTRESVLVILGVLVALTPYAGLPLSILEIVLPVLGLLIVAIALTLRARNAHRQAEVVPVYEAPEV
jgi:VIT1/CCC1 family predicted Fe2+/Mn2+ transporter